MIFRSIVSAMVIVAVASAAVITLPNYSTTTANPHKPFQDDTDITEISTVWSAEKATTAKPTTPATTPAKVMPTESPMVICYCNLPECLAAAGGDGTCSTRLGCFSEVQPIIPGIEEEIVTPAVAESNNTVVNGSSVSPIIPELLESEKAPVAATTEHAASIRGSFGCLDLLPFAKQSCDEMLKSMEAEISEFPIIQAPVNAARSSANNAGVLAFHCCQTQRCNGNLSGPAEGSVKSAQAVLVAALKTAFVAEVENFPGRENSTVGGPGKVDSTVQSSVNEVESNAQKTKSATPDMWHNFFSLGEPKAPSALKSADATEGASLVDATTPAAVPDEVPAELPAMAVPVIQEIITPSETVGHKEHVVAKRHDSKKAVPVIKQQTDEDLQENIGDFDDDIAAEVAAVAATAKSKVMPSIPIEQETPSPWSPRHGGVPDFLPPPGLKKDNNSSSVSRGINNNNKNGSDDSIPVGSNYSSFNDWLVGITCTIIVVFVCILPALGLSVYKVYSDTDVISNYKAECSNPGQPCACSGGVTRRRPRTQPSSCDHDAATTSVDHHACTTPLLPLEELGHKNRGHANAGASYSDSTGDTTYVFTTIPVPNNVAPLMLNRR